MFRNVMISTVAAVSMLAGAAHAAVAVCSVTDISPNAQACTGFFAGNLLSGSPADIAAQTAALATLGFAWDGNLDNVEKIEGLGGSHTVDFAKLLTGISYVAFHYGNGTGGPGNATAFYRVDAGAGIDQFTLAYNASSNAYLYSTGPGGGGVPEPAVWSMMIMGFGLAGAAIRRRRALGAVA